MTRDCKSKAQHNGNMCKPSKSQKETNEVTWCPILKQGNPWWGCPHSWHPSTAHVCPDVWIPPWAEFLTALRIEDMASAALPKPLHGVGNPPRAQQCWSQRGTALPWGAAAHTRAVQQAGGCRSPTLAHLAPILSPSFAPFPRSWPGRVPTILAVPGYLQNAVSVYSLISQGAAFLSFPFLHNVHSWWDPRGPFLGAVPGPSLLGFLLSRHQARALFGTGSLLKQRVAVLQAEGTASDTLSLSLQVSCFCSRHHLEKTNKQTATPAHPVKLTRWENATPSAQSVAISTQPGPVTLTILLLRSPAGRRILNTRCQNAF